MANQTKAHNAGISDFDCRRHGDEWEFLWHQHQVTVRINQLREMMSGTHAELAIYNGSDGPLHWGALSLTNTSQRETLVRKLGRTHPGQDWRGILDRACRKVVEEYRAGAPVQKLEPIVSADAGYLLEKMLPAGETSVIFGDGGAGKSVLALALSVSLSAGVPLPCGLKPVRHARALYLDWESTREEHQERLAGLVAGLAADKTQLEIYYRPMARALADDATRLRAEISQLKIGLVIADSFGPACGIEPEGADAAIRMMNTLRSFTPATRLVIAHVSKATADQRVGASRPYGSVYVTNLARSCWELRRSEDDDGDLVLGLFHRKVNRGRLLSPIGLRLEFGNGAIKIRAQDIAEKTDLLNRTSLSYRILKLLAGGAMSTGEIVEGVEAAELSVTRTLRRLKARGKLINPGDGTGAKGGKGHEQRWGLPL